MVLADYRPRHIEDFVGFDNEKAVLRQNLDYVSKIHAGALAQDQEDRRNGLELQYHSVYVSAPHVLIYGLPGSGKTTLGELYAREMASLAKGLTQRNNGGRPVLDEWTNVGTPPTYGDMFRYVRLDASNIGNFETLDRYILFAAPFAVILIDEIQNLKPEILEKLLELMHDSTWECALTGRRERRMCLTIVGTTTDQGKLSPAIRRRFETQLELLEYSASDLDMIAEDAARRAGMLLSPEGRLEVVDRGRGLPADIIRVINSLHRRMTAADHDDTEPIDADDVAMAAGNINFGPGGLEPAHVRLLSYLAANGETSGRGLRDGCSLGTIDNLEALEVLLKLRGYIQMGTRGRSITPKGRGYLKDHKPSRS